MRFKFRSFSLCVIFSHAHQDPLDLKEFPFVLISCTPPKLEMHFMLLPFQPICNKKGRNVKKRPASDRIIAKKAKVSPTLRYLWPMKKQGQSFYRRRSPGGAVEKIAVYNLLPPSKDFVPFGKWNPSMQGVDLHYYQLIVKQPINAIGMGWIHNRIIMN